MKILALVLIVVVISPVLLGGVSTDPFVSPIPDYCNGIAITPGLDYLFESRFIYGRIKDDGWQGYCWFIGDEQTTTEVMDRFCWLVDWADDTARCYPGPAPLGSQSQAVVNRVWLPVVVK